jgi:hypothetical protein
LKAGQAGASRVGRATSGAEDGNEEDLHIEVKYDKWNNIDWFDYEAVYGKGGPYYGGDCYTRYGKELRRGRGGWNGMDRFPRPFVFQAPPDCL